MDPAWMLPMRTTRSLSSHSSAGHATRTVLLAALAAIALAALPVSAGAATITFDDLGLVHGSVVTAAPGVTIIADNPTRSFDLAVAFDTEATGTEDPDLEATYGGLPRWRGGNLQGEVLGLALILQENSIGCSDGVCDEPDDEAHRPAGTLSFLFGSPVDSVGFDLIDVDSLAAEAGSITFRDTQGGSRTVDFMEFLPAYVYGNRKANRITPFLASALGLGPIDSVSFAIGGSGAIDNLIYTPSVPIPEPTTALFIGLGLGVLGAMRRRAA
jgi:hypothetical protein